MTHWIASEEGKGCTVVYEKKKWKLASINTRVKMGRKKWKTGRNLSTQHERGKDRT